MVARAREKEIATAVDMTLSERVNDFETAGI